MIIKVTENEDFTVTTLTICANNGEPASPQNPIDEMSELKVSDFPEARGILAIISGMPATAQCAVAARYKNCFDAIALMTPRLGGAIIISTTSHKHLMGEFVPLP